MKTVLHVSFPEQWGIAVSNSINLKNTVSDAAIVIVVNALAVRSFGMPSQELSQQLEHLSDLRVEVKLCRNALKANEILETALPDSVQVVPAGIVELIRLQQDGFFYIKP